MGTRACKGVFKALFVAKNPWFLCARRALRFGNRANTVSESTVSNTELSEFFGPHRVPGGKLSEFLAAYYLCAKGNSPSFFAELTEFAPELSEFSSPKQYSRNSIPPVSYRWAETRALKADMRVSKRAFCKR